MLQRLSVAQIEEWKVFHDLEPFGYEVDERRFGTLIAVLTKLLTGTMLPPEQFMDQRMFEPAESDEEAERSAQRRLIEEMKTRLTPSPEVLAAYEAEQLAKASPPAGAAPDVSTDPPKL